MGRLGVRRPPSIVVRSNRNGAAGVGFIFVLTPSPAGMLEAMGWFAPPPGAPFLIFRPREDFRPDHIPSITTSALSRHTSPCTCLEVFFL